MISCGPSSLAGGGDVIALIAFVTFIIIIPAAPWYPEMLLVIDAIVVYQHILVSASDLRLLQQHFGGQLVKKSSIVNTRCLHADEHSRRGVSRLLDQTLDCSKRVFVHSLLVALREYVSGTIKNVYVSPTLGEVNHMRRVAAQQDAFLPPSFLEL
jgi:hypothetical protein